MFELSILPVHLENVESLSFYDFIFQLSVDVCQKHLSYINYNVFFIPSSQCVSKPHYVEAKVFSSLLG